MPDPAALHQASSERDPEAVVARMLGDRTHFAREYWRRVPRLAGGVNAGINYGVEDYLRDLGRTHPRPYISVSSRDGIRRFGRHDDLEGVRAAVDAGSVTAMKLSRFWHGPGVPEAWTQMRSLFGALFRAVGMLYLSPQRSEDVDLFMAGPRSQLGTHFDTTDVFTVQLLGERRWTFEHRADPAAVLALTRSPDWYPAREVPFLGPATEVVLRPGDALYVPAYCVHRVEGVSWSVALSLGLRAVNEIDVVEHLLELIRLQHFADYSPLPSACDADEEAHLAARLELVARARTLLARLEGAALAAALEPLRLPADLSHPDVQASARETVSGPYRSGFAVDDPPGEAR